MLPDYIIYDELKREREGRRSEERPQLEVPRYMPYLPEGEERDRPAEREEPEESSEIVIQMF